MNCWVPPRARTKHEFEFQPSGAPLRSSGMFEEGGPGATPYRHPRSFGSVGGHIGRRYASPEPVREDSGPTWD
eukprot:75839-Pyramimonas_sp.AAC.1